MNDDRLRAVYAELMAARAAEGREGCVTPESVQALVDRAGPEPGRLAVLDHVMACPHCRREFELLRSVTAAEPALSRHRLRGRPLAIAATVALLVTATLVWRGTDDRVPTFRGVDGEVTLITPTGNVAADAPLRLVWHDVEEAIRYDVEVVGESGRPVWSITTTDTTVLVPDSLDIGSASSLRWWVRATLPDSRTVRSVMAPLIRR